jgi:hypothetical protein
MIKILSSLIFQDLRSKGDAKLKGPLRGPLILKVNL